jgi:hypothetical protein
MKTIVNLGVIGAGGFLIYKNVMTLSKTKNSKDMVLPALVLFVSAVAVYHSLPTLLGSTKMGLAPAQAETNVNITRSSSSEETEG